MDEPAAHRPRAAQPQQHGVHEPPYAVAPTRRISIDVVREAKSPRVVDAFAPQVARAHERIERQEMELPLAQQSSRNGARRACAIRESDHSLTWAGHVRSSTPYCVRKASTQRSRPNA